MSGHNIITYIKRSWYYCHWSCAQEYGWSNKMYNQLKNTLLGVFKQNAQIVNGKIIQNWIFVEGQLIFHSMPSPTRSLGTVTTYHNDMGMYILSLSHTSSPTLSQLEYNPLHYRRMASAHPCQRYTTHPTCPH